MKAKYILPAFFIAVLGMVSASFMDFESIHSSSNAKSSGGPTDNTNAPTEKTCSGPEGASACHSGGIADNTGPATTSITSSGGTVYVPGQTYTITCSITHSTRTRFGFQCTVRRLSTNGPGGTIVVTDANNTWLHPATNANCTTCQYLCHKLAGSYFSSTTGSWTFNWTAPSTNVGNIRFYGCFLAANNNNTNDNGDQTFYSTLTLTPSAVGIDENEKFSSSIGISPNPATDFFNVELTLDEQEKISADLFSLDGKFVQHCFEKEMAAGNSFEKVLLGGKISKGVYLLKITSGERTAVKKIVITE